jgi:hypothetical protein
MKKVLVKSRYTCGLILCGTHCTVSATKKRAGKKKCAVFQSSARYLKKIVHMFLVTNFTGNGLKFHVPLLMKIHFFLTERLEFLLET